MRVFLSYGHDDYASLAVRIKHDLEAQGHYAWFDLERLKTGGDWERYIEDGLDFTSAVPSVGRFLLLMTPHSVRRPNGYCLNELARAFDRNLPVIPVMVSTVEPPLSICRLQWLDMRSCYPAEQHEEQYSSQFGQLVKALEEMQVPFEGVQQRLLNYLQPTSYGDDLTRHLLRFTGREWLMTDVAAWLAGSRRMLWITGEAGVGKSAFGAWLCDKRPEIAAYHFCHFGNTDRTDARRALFSLAYQLSTQLSVYRDRLNASPLDKTVVETNVPAVFDRLFVNVLGDAVPLTDKPQVLLIDALDEATRDGRNELASLIGREFDRLPPWLRVIVTSRPYEEAINFALQALDPWKLDAGRRENLDDIRKYLDRELRPFASKGAPSVKLLDTIVSKSEGLFLYVSWVRQELQDGRLSLERLEQFPRGLGGVYKTFFERYFPDPNKYALDCRPALEAICVAREPLGRNDLVAMFDWSEYQMDLLTGQLGSLFPIRDGRVCPFHQSVGDWLTDRQRSGPYYVDRRAGEEQLAEFARRQYKSGVGTMSGYCITYAPSHLAACHRKAELKELLLDPDWVQAKLRAAGVVPLLTDYDLALDVFSPKPSSEDIEALKLIHGAIRLSSNVIAKDPGQFVSQMVGRLLPYRNDEVIQQFIDEVLAFAAAPWLRPFETALHPPGTPLLRSLEGHSSYICGVAVTPDSRWAVSASDDKTLKVWELETGREVRTLQGHSSYVRSVAVTPDGKRVVSASWDKTLKIWDLDTGRPLRTLEGHSSVVSGVAVTPDGKRAVSASGDAIPRDNALRVWELDTGCALRTLEGHSARVYGVAVTPDGKWAVSASEDKTLKVWELDTGYALRTLEGHSARVHGVAVTPDGQRAVSASEDKTLKIWDLNVGRLLRTLEGHAAAVMGLAVTPDGQRAVSASYDNTLKIWDLDTGRLLRTLEGHSSLVSGVAVTPDGKRAVSASFDKTLNVWDLGSGRALPKLEGHANWVEGLAVTPDGKQAVSASRDRTLKVWDLETGRVLRTLGGHSGYVYGVAVMRDGKRAISASADRTLKVWDLQTGHAIRTLEGHYDSVNGVALTADGRWAVSGSGGMAGRDTTLKVWDVETGRALRTLKGHSDSVAGVAVTPDGKRVVSASWDKTLKVWDLQVGRVLRTLEGHTEWVNAVAVTPDGKRAVSASKDKTLKVWDLDTGRSLFTLEGHADWVEGLAVRPDGKRAASASRDKTLKVWDLDTGLLVATFHGDAATQCCAFADAQGITVGDWGGRVYILWLVE